MSSEDVQQGHIVVESKEIEVAKREFLLKMESEYVLTQDYGNLTKNKIRVKTIFNYKRCAQDKNGQDLVSLSSTASFCL